MSWTPKIGHFGDEYANVEVRFDGEGDDKGFVFGDCKQFKYGGVAADKPADQALEDAELSAQAKLWNAEKDVALAEWREKTAYEARIAALLNPPAAKARGKRSDE